MLAGLWRTSRKPNRLSSEYFYTWTGRLRTMYQVVLGTHRTVGFSNDSKRGVRWYPFTKIFVFYIFCESSVKGRRNSSVIYLSFGKSLTIRLIISSVFDFVLWIWRSQPTVVSTQQKITCCLKLPVTSWWLRPTSWPVRMGLRIGEDIFGYGLPLCPLAFTRPFQCFPMPWITTTLSWLGI